jgi:tetratricopeptide (TPR) repeat protein
MPFRKRTQRRSAGNFGNVSADALLLAASASMGNQESLDYAINILAERGGFDVRELNNDDTFLFGQLLKRRYDATGSLNDLQWGLNYMLRAVEGTPRSARNRGMRLQELAQSLLEAVEHMEPGEAIDLITNHLDHARDWLRESLSLADRDRRPTCRSSLGMALVLRIPYLQDQEILPDALAELRQACDEAAVPDIKAACYGNYAKGMMIAYFSDQSRKMLDEAVAAFRQARLISPESSADRVAHTRNLIEALEKAGEDTEARELRRELRQQR